MPISWYVLYYSVMRFHFVAATDEELGELGWLDTRAARHGPYGPLNYNYGLAHDCLEHLSLTEVSDEIQAHAAIYWARYQGGWCNEYGRGVTLESIGSEWIGLARAIQDGHELRMPPKTRPLDSDIEEEIIVIMASGREAIRSEGYDEWQKLADQIEKAFLGWFRIGFRKAARKWKRWNYGPAEVSHLFNQLAKAFKQHEPEHEGQELIVTITKNDGIRFAEPREAW